MPEGWTPGLRADVLSPEGTCPGQSSGPFRGCIRCRLMRGDNALGYRRKLLRHCISHRKGCAPGTECPGCCGCPREPNGMFPVHRPEILFADSLFSSVTYMRLYYRERKLLCTAQNKQHHVRYTEIRTGRERRKLLCGRDEAYMAGSCMACGTGA